MSATREWLADALTDPATNARFVELQRRCVGADELAERVLLCEPGAFDQAKSITVDVYAFFTDGEVDVDIDLFGAARLDCAVLAVEEIDGCGDRDWSLDTSAWLVPLLLQGRHRLDGEDLAALDAVEQERALNVFEAHYRLVLAGRRDRDRQELRDEYKIDLGRGAR